MRKEKEEIEPLPALSGVSLAGGLPSREVPTTRLGEPSSVFLTPGTVYPVVMDDSREDGIGESLARRLIEDRVCVAVSQTKVRQAERAEREAQAATDAPTATVEGVEG